MTAQTALPPGLAPNRQLWPIGVTPNEAYQPAQIFDGLNFKLSVVEFDDQGRCQNRDQMAVLADHLAALESQDAVIVVFVHGWRHDGRSQDDNLHHFCEVLQSVAAQEGDSVPVFGIFVAWRGLSLYGFDFLEEATFWDRKQAGLRVGMGAPRELFGRLHQYRRARLKQPGAAPLVVIIGHSLGGMIVYTALAQSLIEAAGTRSGHIVPSFADLVLLVNPAFEGVRYLPIHDLIKTRDDASFTANQLPVFVSVTAENDLATGLAFPAGMAIALLQERTKGRDERQALIRTMGHLPWMRTHSLALRKAGDAQAPAFRSYANNVVLKKVRFADRNPFWVVSATKDIIDGHNEIWGDDSVSSSKIW